MEKSKIFNQILSKTLVDEGILIKISNTGIPHEFRPLIYKILLGVLTRNTFLHNKQEKCHRVRYRSFFKDEKQEQARGIDNSFELIQISKLDIWKSSTLEEYTPVGIGNGLYREPNMLNKLTNKGIDSPNREDESTKEHADFDTLESKLITNSTAITSLEPASIDFINANLEKSSKTLLESQSQESFSLSDDSALAGITPEPEKNMTSCSLSSIKSESSISDTTVLQDRRFYILAPRELAYILPEHVKAQITIDISRINLEHRIYENRDYSYIYSNILMITAVLRPLTEYIQGMADIIVPFFHLFIRDTSLCLFDIECSIFQCFQKVINKIESNLQSLHTSSFNEILKILKFFDLEIFNYFEKNSIDLSMFGSKWLHCIFIREFSLENWYRLFDSMVTMDLCEFLVFFTVSLIRFLKSRIIGFDGCESIILLQNIRKINFQIEEIESLIGEVNYMKKIFRKK